MYRLKSIFKYKISLFLIASLPLISGCNKFKKQPKTEQAFMISTLNNTLQGKIKKNLGYYCRLFEFQGKDYTAQLNNAMQGIIQEGTNMGANGLIGLQFTTLPISQTNNPLKQKVDNSSTSNNKETQTLENNLNKINSIIQACGDMVIIEYK